MHRLLESLIRISSFFRREIVATLRQTRLMITLVVGPFLILLLFGVGFRNEAVALRTLFVVPEDSTVQRNVEQFATSISPQLLYAGMVTDQATALNMLHWGRVDIVVVTPTDPYELIRHNRHATFVVYHNEIDPARVEYVNAFGSVYVEALNRRILREIARRSQDESQGMWQDIAAVHEHSGQLRQAMAQEDFPRARQALLDLEEKLDGAQTALSVGAAALAALLDASGALGSYGEILSPEAQLAEIRREIDVLKNLESDQLQESTEEIEKLDENLKRLDRLAEQFEGLDPAILVSPFRDQVESVVPVPLSNSDYYAPSVIVLLLQHLCVTFGALAIVREQKMGTIELFQVSPLSSIEILLGKYLSYLVVAVIVGVVLTGLLVFLLGVPLLGSIWAYAAVMLLLAFASLGMGFVLSLFAGTISQAVQYTMMLLLASVFFSGFFLNLEAMSLPVRALSRVLPASYGVQLLQDVALRGELLDPKLVVRLTALAMISFGLAWYLLRRVLRRV